jgi:cellulose synthase/poly-beta-1,6-N-acetylglucosamine synthase-like glycosyltransferase
VAAAREGGVLFVENLSHIAFLLAAVVFLNRYIGGTLLRFARSGSRQVDELYEPTVTIVVPCYNEGRTVYDTLRSLAALDYPCSKLSIVVMDDASDAVTVAWLQKAEAEIPILSVTYQKTNRGKRLNIAQAVRRTDAAIILSVDSDCQIEPPTLRRLLRHFSRPDVAAVGGSCGRSMPTRPGSLACRPSNTGSVTNTSRTSRMLSIK